MGICIASFLSLNHYHHLSSSSVFITYTSSMPKTCKECGLEFDNKNLHDAHWKKCVKVVTFVAYNGQEITVARQLDKPVFLCHCSHSKCPRSQGFTTVDALHKHMKTLKTTWLGSEKKKVNINKSTNFMVVTDYDCIM